MALLSAIKMAFGWVKSAMTARILLSSRMGLPCLLVDLTALRRVSAIEWLIMVKGLVRGFERGNRCL